MKITKFVHSCLLVETPERTALFDPGVYSTVDKDSLRRLDYLVLTHIHPDHFNPEVVRELVSKFPNVHVVAPEDVMSQLGGAMHSSATAAVPPEDIVLFNSPHEGHAPFLAPPPNIGIHYLDQLTHPGDSHSFTETKAVLALPVQAPWGSTMAAVDVALGLRPKYIVPIHDWHWRDEAREWAYERMEELFGRNGITFLKAVNGQPFEISV